MTKISSNVNSPLHFHQQGIKFTRNGIVRTEKIVLCKKEFNPTKAVNFSALKPLTIVSNSPYLMFFEVLAIPLILLTRYVRMIERINEKQRMSHLNL